MRTIVAAVAITGVALAVDAGLLRSDHVRDLLAPAPEKVVQGFVGAVAAGRPETAREHLAEDTRARLSSDELGARADAFRARHGDYRYEDGELRRRGDVAEVDARLGTQRAGTIARTFRLARDPKTYLWKITELEL